MLGFILGAMLFFSSPEVTAQCRFSSWVAIDQDEHGNLFVVDCGPPPWRARYPYIAAD